MRKFTKSIICFGIFLLELPVYIIVAFGVTLYWARDEKDRSWLELWRIVRAK